jgi:hypothetical protein
MQMPTHGQSPGIGPRCLSHPSRVGLSNPLDAEGKPPSVCLFLRKTLVFKDL